MGIYNPSIDSEGLKSAIENEFGVTASNPLSPEAKAVAKCSKSFTTGKAIRTLKENGWTDAMINSLLLETAKKSKKKKDDEKDEDTSTDDIDSIDLDDSDSDSSDSKSKSKGSDDSDSDKDSSNSDSDDDDKDLHKDVDDDKKSKKSKKKDDDDKDDEKDDDDKDEDDKKSKKKKGKKNSKKKEDDLEEHGSISSNSPHTFDPIKAIEEEFDAYFKVGVKSVPIPKPRGFLEATRLRVDPSYERPFKTPEFNRAVMENLDMSDHNTRVIMTTVDEDDQSIVLQSLTNKLYDMIVDKSTDIDYGEIPNTKGDIDALSNIAKIEECLDTISSICTQYKQPTDQVDIVKRAIDNTRERKELFMTGYQRGAGFTVFTYQTVVLAIVASTSLLISSCIEFIKNPGSESFSISFDKAGMSKSKNSLLFNNLREYNKICDDKSIDKALTTTNATEERHFLGTSTMATLALAGAVAVILFNILPILRELTYFFYYTRTRISDYFNLQADLLEINAERLKQDEPETVGNRNMVIKRQKAIAERFRKLADFFMIDSRQTEGRVVREISQTKKTLKADDIMDNVPDSTASALF